MTHLPVVTPAEPVRSAPRGEATVEFGEGFFARELADGLPFRWMAISGVLSWVPTAEPRYLELWVHSHFHDGSQRLTCVVGDAATEHVLARGWNHLSLAVAPRVASARLMASKPFPREYYPSDGRELALQVRGVTLHEDAVLHAHTLRQHQNGIANLGELLAGKVMLESKPPKLGIDIQGACNVKPPCVYCAWDLSKEQEGRNVDVPFTADTLAEWGEFFENSQELVNCSIGEPFMGKNMDELLDAFGARGKVLEMTTNGQILTDANIRRLLGRNVHLYVSLDAATPETYARLRNARFDLVLENVRRLVAAKGGPGHLPLVYLVFMPMKCNAGEVDAFVRLCRELGADRLVLRPLNDSAGLELKWERAGYPYEYQKELLPWEQLVRISGRVAELSHRLGVELSDQLDFGGAMEAQFAEAYAAGRSEAARLFEAGAEASVPSAAPRAQAAAGAAPPPVARPLPSLGAEKLPACIEPWTSLYILRRGLRPCCYGGASIGDMGDYAEAWNAPLVQDIRRELLKGGFHRYCYDSPDCPIVKKAHEAHALSAGQEAQRQTVRAWNRVKRTGGIWYRRIAGKARRSDR